jgi:HAD superfamily hydrolase (TIGR01509 family)
MRSLELTDYIAVVSDFDDTILDNKAAIPGQGLHQRSRLDAIRAVGKAWNLEALSSLPSHMSAVAFQNAPIHSAEGAFHWLLLQQGVIRKEEFNPQHPLIQALVAAKASSYRALLATEAQEVRGARNFFRTLHEDGFKDKLAIASTGQRADILEFLKTHGFGDYFSPEHIYASEDTKRPKPDPESFRLAIGSLGIQLSEAPRVLAFEDDPRGIEAAKALGMFVCAVTTRFNEDSLMNLPTPPDIVAADFSEYAKVFGL